MVVLLTLDNAELSISPLVLGFYCPSGTGFDQQPCPTGTYSPATLLATAAECLPCIAGQYCNSVNTSTTTGPCKAGFFCHNGSDTATPSGQNKGHAGICPPGSYCEAGDPKAPVACPAGKPGFLLFGETNIDTNIFV